jgi:succinate dehydrogenase/fumarate reductase flavoprotein subunit
MERLQPSGIDILVVGAGIGGLCAAIELGAKGTMCESLRQKMVLPA